MQTKLINKSEPITVLTATGFKASIGFPVTFEGFQEFQFRACRRSDTARPWTVIETLTGLSVSHGKTRAKAIAATAELLTAVGLQAFRKHITEAAETNGYAPPPTEPTNGKVTP